VEPAFTPLLSTAARFELRARARVACRKVGLDRPLIPTAFVANLFRSARVSRSWPIQPSRCLVQAAQGRQIGAWRRQPQVTAMATIIGVVRGAWSDKASGTGHRDGHDHSPSLEPHSGGRSSIWSREFRRPCPA